MKAMSDTAITTIVALITAVIALVVIWIFLSKSFPSISDAIGKFTCSMCRAILPGMIEGICGSC